MKIWLIAILLGSTSAQAQAPRGPRPLEVLANAAWKHAATGLVLPATIDGSRRTAIGDNGVEELDIIAQYSGADGLTTTVYLFRSQLPVAPLWFDRGQTVLEQLHLSRNQPRGTAPPVVSPLPGGFAPSLMQVTYPLDVDGFQSTALGVAQVGGWLVKVRMSSKTDAPAQLEQKLASFMGAMSWPAGAKASTPPEPIQPCADKLAFKRAKMVKPDMADALLGSLVALAGSMKAPDPSARYCREQKEGVLYSTYRPLGSNDGYLMAIADSGRLLSVARREPLEKKGKVSYAVTLLDLGRSAVYPSFDRLPEPKQVLQLIQTQRPMSSNRVGTTTIELDAGNKR